ncbi:MAG: protein translocase subunit SecD [Actinomycetota bacterium]
MQQVRWRAIAVLALVVGAVVLIATQPARLGLDLKGGTQIILEAQDSERQRVDGDTVNRTLEVLRRRVDALGVTEPSLQRSGDRRILIELPGVEDPDEAVDIIGRTAQLRFHPVLAGAPEPDDLVLFAESGEPLRLAPAAVTGDDVATATARVAGEFAVTWQVQVDFRGDGSRRWETLTGQAACAPLGDPARRIAIVLDEDVISSPEVAAEVNCPRGISGGTTVITGNFSQAEARELALLIRAGALPVPVEIVGQTTIGPTLGKAAIEASIKAAIIGALLTALYMVVYYRLLGVLAVIALGVYGALSFAVLLLLGATLTLPGIAGFVLAVGMAVDANVLVYERIKEEHAGGASTRAAGRNGFRRAWSAIADSNATTVIAAMLLFFFASGAVRGFGVTVTVGVLTSMFTALVVTRLMVDVVLRTRLRNRPRLLGLEVGARLRTWISTARPDLMRHSGRFLGASGLAVVLAITGVGVKGLDLGLEFSGGRLIEYRTERPPDLDLVRSELARAGFPRAVVQAAGDAQLTVRIETLTPEEQSRVVAAVEAVGGRAEVMRDEFVGPTIGDELRRKALIALAIALAAQLAYLAVRFKWTYGAGAVVAMVHDVLILLGLFAWLGKDLDGVFLAALLTVIGYSVNDSVVVFDRIRELRRARPRELLRVVANDACLQTVPRTINTGLGAMFILVVLWQFGGDTLADFALALLVGLVVGTYSSVLTATPVALWLENHWGSGDRRPPQAERAQPASASAPLAQARSHGHQGADPGGDADRSRAVAVRSRPPTPQRPVSQTRPTPARPAAAAPRPRKNKRRKPGRRRN